MRAQRRTALLLAALALLFLLRVLGQVLVAFFGVAFLPAMADWYSGLLPYPLLLPTQIAILALQAKVSADLWRGSGAFSVPRPRTYAAVRWFSLVYFAGMGMRYALTMGLYPERRWLGRGTIPIAFHFVLASWLWVLARHQLRAARSRA